MRRRGTVTVYSDITELKQRPRRRPPQKKRPSPKQTRSSSPFPINSGSTTTLTSSRRSLSTSRRGLAGGDAFALGSHVTFVSGVRNIRFEFRVSRPPALDGRYAALAEPMSALCQKRTLTALFNHLGERRGGR